MEARLFVELKRRRVFRALVGYGIAAFAVLQIVEPVMHGLRWPEATLSWIVIALAAGFPLVVALAWIFDVRDGRIERTPGTPLRAPLALVLVGIGVLAAVPGLAWYFLGRARPAPAVAPSIAVLPFADMSPGKDQEYFSDGIAEEILNSLAQVEGLRVAGRTSSFSFKGKGDDLGVIAEKLRVAHVLEGSVRKDGNRVRITAQLIAAADGYHVWSKTFDKELTGVFAVQDEIAKAVVEALRLKLLPAKRRVTNPEAYAQFLLANQLVRQHPDRKPVVAAYRKSIELDPGYAPAWAGLSIESWVLAQQDVTPEQLAKAQSDMLTGAEKALQLDPELPDSYAARATVRSAYLWDWEGARADYRHTIALAPSDPVAHLAYGIFLRDTGDLPGAISEMRKAAELDPLDRMHPNNLGIAYSDQGQYAQARIAFQHARDLIRDPSYDAEEIAFTYLFEGQLQQAQEWFGRSYWEPARLLGRALVAHARGDAREASSAKDAFLDKFGPAQPSTVAALFAFLGEADRAFEALDRAFANHDPGLRAIKVEPLLRSLHADPRWPAFLEKMNLRPD